MNILSTKIICRVIVFTGLIVVLSACASSNVMENGEAISAWDFDHEVHFLYTKIDEHNHQLSVVPSNKVSFGRLSAFLMRKSYLICGSYGYKVEILNGVESFDHNRASPNLIMPNLTANLECPVK